jgi:hypothetical protein
MKEVRSDGAPNREREPHDQCGLAQCDGPDSEHLATEELDWADHSKEDLHHPARLLLHDTDQDPGAVLGQHEEQEDYPDH